MNPSQKVGCAMRNKIKIVQLISIIVIILFLSGCSQKGYESIKENSQMTKEYNDTIGIYNKLALSSTSLAKNMEKEIEKTNGFDEEFWKGYDEAKEKIVHYKKMIGGYQFKHNEVQVIMNEIEPFLDDLEEYLDGVNKFRASSIDREHFINSHNAIYKKLLSKSSTIVRGFDSIYNDSLTKKN